MILSIIVAAAENQVIGNNNQLIWRLSADLKRFKSLTTGHPVIMGRKTFESIGKALPNRRNIVITAQRDYQAEGCEIAPDIPSALAKVEKAEEAFIIGGGSIYRETWGKADKLYLTLVHVSPAGDTFIPAISPEEWTQISRTDFQADEKNEYDYSFIDYQRKI